MARAYCACRLLLLGGKRRATAAGDARKPNNLAHEIVPCLELGRILRIPVRACLRHSLQCRYALAWHWMRLQVRIDVARLIEALVRHPLEGHIHALCRLAACCEEPDAGAVCL